MCKGQRSMCRCDFESIFHHFGSISNLRIFKRAGFSCFFLLSLNASTVAHKMSNEHAMCTKCPVDMQRVQNSGKLL
ncbi:hypothetical protein LguiB_020981 [Lonicera macranthoides]